ncbi:MAG: nucleotidyltransferase family protein [Elusimicrobia bacterium]|nr:nucleotidyltransferase family protein [Elusimicrobiota bacterium]
MTVETELVSLLSVLRPDVLRLDRISSLIQDTRVNIDLFISQVIWHKVKPQVLFNLAHIYKNIRDKSRFFQKVEDYFLEYSPNAYDKNQIAKLFMENINNIQRYQKDMIFLKGSILQALYCQNTHAYRQMNDIDVLFPDFPAFCTFLNSLPFIGYEYPDKMQLNCRHVQPVKGKSQIPLSKVRLISAHCVPIGYPKNKSFRKIDFNFGDYLYIPTANILQDKRLLSFNRVNFYATSVIDEIVILIAHAVDHVQTRWLWINDLYILCKYEDINWNNLFDKLRQRGLLTIFGAWIDILSELYNESKLIPPVYAEQLVSAFDPSRNLQKWVKKSIIDKPSAYVNYKIKSAVITNSSKYFLSAKIVIFVLFVSMLKEYIPYSIINFFKKITDPIKIFFHIPVALPRLYGFEQCLAEHYEGNSLFLEWDVFRGFKVSFQKFLLREE